MGKIIRNLAAMAFAAATVAGCAGGQLTGAAGDRDGQSLAAKPDMARLYLIHGYSTTGATTHPSGEAVPGSAAVYYYDHKYTAGEAIAAGTIGGGAIGLIAALATASDYDDVDKPIRGKRLSVTYEYFLDDMYIGDIGGEQYMALDLPPGSHSVRFEQPIGTSPTAPIDLKPGETAFLMANVSKVLGAYWERCSEDCAALIPQDHRVVADLSGRAAARRARGK